MPLHSLVFTSGKPASAMLGTSGNSGERSDPVNASARTLPSLICGIAGGPSEIENRQCSWITHRIISALLLSGRATPGAPVLSLKSSLEIFFFQAEDGIRDYKVTGVQTCALPI